MLLTQVIFPRSTTTSATPPTVTSSTAAVKRRVSSPPVRFFFGVSTHTLPIIARSIAILNTSY
jgi:hypothetical protein